MFLKKTSMRMGPLWVPKILLAILFLAIGIVGGLGWDEAYQRWIFRKSLFARSQRETTLSCLSCSLSPTISFSFDVLRNAEILYEKGYKREAKHVLESFENPLWIEPEILQKTGLWALEEGKEDLAYEKWRKLSERFPLSKAFHKISRPFALLQAKKGRSNVANSP